MLTSLLGMANVSASNVATASFALPFSGFAVTRTFRKSPSQPSIFVREEPGTTLTFSNAMIPIFDSVRILEMRIEYQPDYVTKRIQNSSHFDAATNVVKGCVLPRAEAQ